MKKWTVKIIVILILFIIGTKKIFNSGHHIVNKPATEIDSLEIIKQGTPEEYLMEALIYYEIKHPEIVYAQALLETGNFTSSGCINKNNLFGLMKGRKLRSFNHWTESVIFYKERIQSRYDSGNYYTFLERIRYATDKTYTLKLKQIVNEQRRSEKRDSLYTK